MQDEYWAMVQEGLDGEAPLKLILKGWMEEGTGVVAVVFATLDKVAAEKRLKDLVEHEEDGYFMVYSVPLDTDLRTIGHYPSIGITKEDFEQ